MKILIVDDSQMNRYILKKFINSYNKDIIIDEASNGNQAVNNAKQEYSLIFMDIIMPYKDGIQASKEILEINPQQKIIILSGMADTETNKKIKSLGIMSFLIKPIAKESVHSLLKHVMDNKQ